ncbi:hypothetical protein EV421DRAFT_1737457 [Armillaria borealis]|uniref:Uncharacterized protein n=1 Tax=Armillaria borealis TaxID=47425 RepID=A0AA39MNN2_9AGAR|nr:hypothetical protein EV421DRAFT_1737457 [Armillaria borealis]
MLSALRLRTRKHQVLLLVPSSKGYWTIGLAGEQVARHLMLMSPSYVHVRACDGAMPIAPPRLISATWIKITLPINTAVGGRKRNAGLTCLRKTRQMLLLLSVYLPRRMPLRSGDRQYCRSLSKLRTVFGTRVVQCPNLRHVVQILLCLHFRSERQKAHLGLETFLAGDTDEQLVVGAEFETLCLSHYTFLRFRTSNKYRFQGLTSSGNTDLDVLL